MLTITARNVNDAWYQAKQILNQSHLVRPSRVGEVWEFSSPVTTEYLRPTERVLFDPVRNANPYFHIFEAMWMLAGRNDVAWLSQFNPRMKEFSDDGKTFHGAYGHRWRVAFDMDGGAEDGYADQLPKIVKMLKKSQEERRAVLCMWNPIWDLDRPDVKDVPCNDIVFFKIREGKLTMTVCCRSNDIAWGCYAANAVHFSFLQEYMAAMIGVPVGTYWQVSDSWHAYTERWYNLGGFNNQQYNPYDGSWPVTVEPFPLVSNPETFDEEVKLWCNTLGQGSERFSNHFFSYVLHPLYMSWKVYKEDELNAAYFFAKTCRATDWSLAATQWLDRIQKKRQEKLNA